MTDRVRPFWGRVAVSPSPVDEEQRPSGLIVPLNSSPKGPPPDRGVVLAVDPTMYHGASDQIPPGTVVYYRGGTAVRDVVVVDANQIIAYEETE